MNETNPLFSHQCFNSYVLLIVKHILVLLKSVLQLDLNFALLFQCTCNVWCFVYWLFFFLVIVVVDAIKVLEKPHILKSFQEVKKANLCLRWTIQFLPYLCIPNRQNNILCLLCHSQNPDD